MILENILPHLWPQLVWPLLRLIFFISLSLLVANFIEALNWTERIAFLARPLIRFGKLSNITGASFSMAFFSGVTSNTLLAEAYEKKELTRKELLLANLFNSLPTYFLHLPTTFFITVPLIKGAAFLYIGLTFGAAVVRTLSITLLSRFLLVGAASPPPANDPPGPGSRIDLARAWQKTWQRFKKRIRKICIFTIPIYVVFFFINKLGVFTAIENFMATHLAFLSWLSPEAMSIIALHIAAEFTAGLAAAGALMQSGTLELREVVLALLVGNILSSPVRAIRHQFPYYAGIFPPRLAMQLILCSQAFRALSIMLVALLYFVF